jgi:hypothetical protein
VAALPDTGAGASQDGPPCRWVRAKALIRLVALSLPALSVHAWTHLAFNPTQAPH